MAREAGAFNTLAWQNGDYVAEYADTSIRPEEAMLVARWREGFTGRVLELGCGAGRLTLVLADLAAELLAVDVSPAMVAACRAAVPAARVEVGDLRDLRAVADGSFDAVVASANVLDVLGEDERRAALTQIASFLAPGGLLLFSAHNRAHLPHVQSPTRLLEPVAWRSPRSVARAARHAHRLPARAVNRRRTREFERVEADFAIINDGAHDNRLAHYYVTRDAQARQLTGAGLTLLACVDQRLRTVAAGESAATSSALHYLARRED